MNEYWSKLQQQYQQLAIQIDRLVLRERVLLLITLIVIIYAFCNFLLISPVRKEIDLAKIEETALVKQITESQQKIAYVEKNVTTLLTNPQPPNITPGSIPVTESTVTAMFESLLAKQQKIILKGLSNLPNQPLNLPVGNIDIPLKLPLPLYEQKIHLIFNGDYLSTYEYLRSVEDLKWMIFWDEIQYTVTQYPNAEIRLTVYTIGPNKKT